MRTKITEMTTARCVLRPLAPVDEAELHRLWTSAGVRRFLWDDESIPLETTRSAIEQSERMFREQAAGLWGARLSGSPGLVAFSGLWPFRGSGRLELVYGVDEAFWGQGYAAEIARAVVQYAFEALAMPVVHASTDPPNAASIRVLEKLGFRLTRRETVSGLDTVFFELPR